MYAIVNIQGSQMKVQKDQKIYVNRMDAKEGDKVKFEEVLIIENDGNISVGLPTISNASVSATILKHLKDDKVTVFKKKRRKGYQKSNGHRQYLTQIQIESILG